MGILGWVLILYVVLKVCHLVFGPRAIARGAGTPISTRLRAGEPMLALGVFGCSAALILYSSWWTHRFAGAWYSYSSDCYAKVAAAHRLPPRPSRLSGFRAFEAAEGSLRFAEKHGAQLGIPVSAIDSKLKRDTIALEHHYEEISAANDRQAVAAAFAGLDRCMRGAGSPRGEILRP